MPGKSQKKVWRKIKRLLIAAVVILASDKDLPGLCYIQSCSYTELSKLPRRPDGPAGFCLPHRQNEQRPAITIICQGRFQDIRRNQGNALMQGLQREKGMEDLREARQKNTTCGKIFAFPEGKKKGIRDQEIFEEAP